MPRIKQRESAETLPSLRNVRAGVLDVAYHEVGDRDGPAVVLLHGFPYDVHSYIDVAPVLAEHGLRVIVPYLRGHGPTRFIASDVPRSGQQAALGTDVVELLDALDIDRAVLAGFDWGGRAACVVAAMWPERCAALVSVNSYLIQDIVGAIQPIDPILEAGFWYFFYFATERGRRGLEVNRRAIAKVIWARNSPAWKFDDHSLDRAAKAFENPDYVDVVIHSYRHRLGLAEGDPRYDEVERALSKQPAIAVPTITLDGTADGNFPDTDGSASAHHFVDQRIHRRVPNAGHNLPQEAPQAFAQAVLDIRGVASGM